MHGRFDVCQKVLMNCHAICKFAQLSRTIGWNVSWNSLVFVPKEFYAPWFFSTLNLGPLKREIEMNNLNFRWIFYCSTSDTNSRFDVMQSSFSLGKRHTCANARSFNQILIKNDRYFQEEIPIKILGGDFWIWNWSWNDFWVDFQ